MIEIAADNNVGPTPEDLADADTARLMALADEHAGSRTVRTRAALENALLDLATTARKAEAAVAEFAGLAEAVRQARPELAVYFNDYLVAEPL